MSKLLEVEDLEVSFKTYAGEVQAVRDVSFYVDRGESIAVVGESGCGKSVTMQSILGLLSVPPAIVKKGSIRFDGKDITKLNDRQMEALRGPEMSIIFQDPMTSLNPTMVVGEQISDGIVRHQKINKKEAFQKAIDMLSLVGIPNPERRARQYPHEFSGGMRQRVMIAIALACNPKLLIADEPTTALDVTIQAQILDLMRDIQKKFGTSIVMITHNLGVVANIAERVLVMYAGKIIESASVDDIFYSPQHPYTVALLKSFPNLNTHRGEKLTSIEGTPPDLIAPPPGCAFAPRCEYAMKACESFVPETFELGGHHECSCWLLHKDVPEDLKPFWMRRADR